MDINSGVVTVAYPEHDIMKYSGYRVHVLVSKPFIQEATKEEIFPQDFLSEEGTMPAVVFIKYPLGAFAVGILVYISAPSLTVSGRLPPPYYIL